MATFQSVSAANLMDFKRIAAEALAVTVTEPGTLQYDWFFNDDETVCVIQETYEDSDAFFAHFGNVGALLGPLMEKGGVVKLDVFGTPSQEVQDALAAFQPTLFTLSQGK
jgi:Antibiotic biosynthesis monooxygenase